MTLQENDIVTTHHLADAWRVRRSVAVKRARRLENKLCLKRVKARAPRGQIIAAYSKADAERMIAEHRKSEARRKANTIRKKKKVEDVKWDFGTAKRPDVMTIHKLAKKLGTSRVTAGKIARRLEDELGIQRVPARAAKGHKITAYRRWDGERIVKVHKAKRAEKHARRKGKEKHRKEIGAIPQPPAPTSKTEHF